MEEIQAVLVQLDQRADKVATLRGGRRFATLLRVIVSELRLELGLQEPRTK